MRISPLRQAITAAYRMDETQCVEGLLQKISFSIEARERAREKTRALVLETRAQRKKQSHFNSLLHQYQLSSEEGTALMCLAEALLRIPDAHTRDLLISDKISRVDWMNFLKSEKSLFANAAAWSLTLTGKIFSPAQDQEKGFLSRLKKSLSSPGVAILRPMVMQGMKMLGDLFVAGSTIEDALKQAQKTEALGYRYSYDMLGEAARTAEDAQRYYESYRNAIIAIGGSQRSLNPIQNSGISIKLSALHPRYEYNKEARLLKSLGPHLLELVKLAKKHNVNVTLDAEEADRLDLSLDLFENLFSSPELAGWEGLGLAVQAYQKRASYVLDWLADLSQRNQRRILVRLVKGAYWDSEIKQSQILGLEGYPVFTRKHATDLSYLVCAKQLLERPDCFYAQFATHNAQNIAAILEMAGERRDFEFQCLHGMGRTLYDQIVDKTRYNLPTRIYAPVGLHQDLVGYLVRRLLENGANSSFINQLGSEQTPLEDLLADPIELIAACSPKPHPHIPLPKNLYPDRCNSQGLDLSNRQTLSDLKAALDKKTKQSFQSGPLLAGKSLKLDKPRAIHAPANPDKTVGHVEQATEAEMEEALKNAESAKTTWAKVEVGERAQCLERAADLLQKALPSFISLLCLEGGKTIPDCISEIREAIDFCRYYAARARMDFKPQILAGPTGESNQLTLHPRGLVLCISPWNFPLAIFTGQIVAALVCGNVVIAKPAEQTPLVAAEMVHLLHEAGIPKDVLQLLPGKGAVIGAKLVADSRVSAVMFTGSTETAQFINRSLAAREGPLTPFIAETGGQNAMIVDSSALPEQTVADILTSAFNSAGQRCSALRVLFVQEEIAPRLLSLLQGAMAELDLGDPEHLTTDVGPVIDSEALKMLEQHAQKLRGAASLLYQVPLPPHLKGSYFAPCLFELKDLSLLSGEVFGPILHVIRYPANGLDGVLDQIIQTGYGLTLGAHSRIESTIQYIVDRMPIGNRYVNRNMIGAVVGVQPFGGERLSGTGPKAGGPHYLPRLCVERSLSINTTAVGGNAALVTLSEDS